MVLPAMLSRCVCANCLSLRPVLKEAPGNGRKDGTLSTCPWSPQSERHCSLHFRTHGSALFGFFYALCVRPDKLSVYSIVFGSYPGISMAMVGCSLLPQSHLTVANQVDVGGGRRSSAHRPSQHMLLTTLTFFFRPHCARCRFLSARVCLYEWPTEVRASLSRCASSWD